MDRTEAVALLTDAARIAGVDADIVLPDDRYVVLGGMRFHYLDWPGATSPAIVLLHGGGLTAHTWDLVCLGLRTDCRCIALDQRGHGDSDHSPGLDYSIETHSRDLAGFLDSLWLGEVVLVGQSMGGLSAMTFAARNPRSVRALVLVDVGPEVHDEGARRTRDFIRADHELPSVEDFVERAIAFNPRRDRRLLRRSLLHNLRQLDNGNWTWKYDRRPFVNGHFGERVRHELRELRRRIPSIRCPTLVVRGEESDVLGAEGAERFAEALPDGRWVSVPGAGHTVQGDEPRRLTEEIRTFLVDVGVGRPPRETWATR